MEQLLLPDNIIKGTISGAKGAKYTKAKIQRLKLANTTQIQISLFTEKQVFHKNFNDDEINQMIFDLFINEFKNMELYTTDYIYSYRITSKNKILSNKRKNTETLVSLDHNKTKSYLLPEGVAIPPLVDLGVMTIDGKIVKSKYDKYKQINRFIEIIDDSIKNESKLKIIDFGCGKSYLTFILYYYLAVIKKIDCEIIGLDLKDDVIKHCNEISNKYGYSDRLKFYIGDIAKYNSLSDVDMIITLHACDTATDYALYHAINMKCRYIFSVPCCQHEINSQLNSTYLHMVNKFGILKERFSAILTDSIRANVLQYFGYKTQVMEFVDIENSPKNLLIRAVLTNNKPNEKIKDELDEQLKLLNVEQTLYNLVFK